MDKYLYFFAGFTACFCLILIQGFVSLIWGSRKSVSAEYLERVKQMRNSPEYKNQMEINAKLKEVRDLTHEQDELMNMIDQPSKNGLHSQQKNAAGAKIRELHDRKVAILQSIIDGGIDYELYFAKEDGTTETVMLSEYLKMLGGGVVETPVDRRSTFKLIKTEDADKPKLDN